MSYYEQRNANFIGWNFIWTFIGCLIQRSRFNSTQQFQYTLRHVTAEALLYECVKYVCFMLGSSAHPEKDNEKADLDLIK